MDEVKALPHYLWKIRVRPNYDGEQEFYYVIAPTNVSAIEAANIHRNFGDAEIALAKMGEVVNALEIAGVKAIF